MPNSMTTIKFESVVLEIIILICWLVRGGWLCYFSFHPLKIKNKNMWKLFYIKNEFVMLLESILDRICHRNVLLSPTA